MTAHDDDRSGLLTLAAGATNEAVNELLERADDEYQLASLIHGLLRMYSAAARTTRTDLGFLAIGVMLEDIADGDDQNPDQREAARLILAHDAARDSGDEDSVFRDFGASFFNEILIRVDDAGRAVELTVAIATVWRRLMPELHTAEGLEILRRGEW
jgi:hypothetical protein